VVGSARIGRNIHDNRGGRSESTFEYGKNSGQISRKDHNTVKLSSNLLKKI
jgi:hypothetical protein